MAAYDDAEVAFLQMQSAVANLLGVIYLKNRSSRRRRWWVHPLNQRRINQGDFHNLLSEMRNDDPVQFRKYMRMTPAQFDTVLNLVSPLLKKSSNRTPLPEAFRLSITLRFLATGDSFPSLAWSYRIGTSTCCQIINETCRAIWDGLHHIYLGVPDVNKYKMIADCFNEVWNLPNCTGAIDGKHVIIQAPCNSGSQFFNYKKTHSIVLMAVCDAQYCFTHVDIGAYGSQSDGGILRNSQFGHRLTNDLLPLPQPAYLPHTQTPVPFYFVGDEAFPLKRNLMRPFSKASLTTLKSKVYNFRHSRGRRVVENAFGILVARWRVFHRVINAKPENADNIVKATVCLHNFLRLAEINALEQTYCPPTFMDREVNGGMEEGEWRRNIPQNGALQCLRTAQLRLGSRNAASEALEVRDVLANYFMSPAGAIAGQTQYVLRGLQENAGGAT